MSKPALTGNHLDETVFGPPSHAEIPHGHTHAGGGDPAPGASHWHPHFHPGGWKDGGSHNHLHFHPVNEEAEES